MVWSGASPMFTEALRHPHTLAVRVDAQREGELLPPDVIGADYYAHGLPVQGGYVTIDSSSQVRRQLELTLGDASLNPRNASAPLAPYGTELVVKRGIRYPSGETEWVPLGIFRLDEAQGSVVGGEVRIVAPDRSRAVADARFTTPRQSKIGMLITLQIAELVTEVLPRVEVIDQTGSTAVTPRTVWAEDRWGAIEELATSIGAEVLFDPLGRCVIRIVPSVSALPAWWVNVGVNGTVIGGGTAISRSEVRNGVAAKGERADDAPPVYALVVDDDPNSPTWWNGPFGQVPEVYSSNLITTRRQAVAAATGLLNRKKVAVHELDLELVPNPLIEAGDVLAVQYRDFSVDRMMMVSTTIPLDTSSQQAHCRSGQVYPDAPPAIPPPDGAPGGLDMLIGAAAGAKDGRSGIEEFEYLEGLSGRALDVRRSFTSNFPASFTSHPANDDVGHRVSVASVKSSPDRMAKGLDDALVTGFVESIPDGHVVYLTWQHEAEATDKHNDPAVIRAGGQRFARLVKEARGDKAVHVTWVFMGYSFAPISGRDPNAWYWGDRSVEVVAVDAYNGYTNVDRKLDAENFVGLAQAHRFARSRGRRFGVAEWGCYDLPATNRPGFLTHAIPYLQSLSGPVCEFATYFHSAGTKPGFGGYWLDTSTESIDAWRAAIA